MNKLKEIENAVCAEFGIDGETLRKKSQRPDIVVPRQVAMYFAEKRTRLTQGYIGDYFGGYNYSTVNYSSKKVKEYIDVDKILREKIERINLAVNGLGRVENSIYTIRKIVSKMSKKTMENDKMLILELLDKL